jgi:hypothetical protein
LLYQGTQALVSAGIAAYVQFVHVEDRTNAFDRLPCDGHSRAGKLSQSGWGDEADEQAKDGDNDKQFQ